MQAFKTITIPSSVANGSEGVKAYYVNGGQVNAAGRDFINEEIAGFLRECGVDAEYKEIPESYQPGVKWLWIWGKPFLFYLSVYSGNSQYLRFSTPFESNYHNLYTNEGTSVISKFGIVFTGNPNSAFVLRFMLPTFDGFSATKNSCIRIAKLHSELYTYEGGLVGFNYGTVRDTLAILYSKPSMGPYYYFGYTSTLDMTSAAPGDELTRYLLDGKYPMIPMSWYFVKSDSLFFRIPLTSAYSEFPEAMSINSLWQREVTISGKRYIIADNMYMGLILLDDDDPEIPEGEVPEVT